MTRDEIKKVLLDLSELHRAGSLSEEEFRREKAPLLKKLRQTTWPSSGSGASSTAEEDAASGSLATSKKEATEKNATEDASPSLSRPQPGHDFFATGGEISPLPETLQPAGETPLPASPGGMDHFLTGGGTPPIMPAPDTPATSPVPASPLADGIRVGGAGLGEVGEGTLLQERYRVKRLLGTGGMGRVYLCQDQMLDSLCALKMIHPHLAQLEEVRQRFLNELAMMEQLTHPGIVRSYALSQDEATGCLFYTMEYVEGETLEVKLERELQRGNTPPFSLEETLALLSALVEPLDYAHRQGIVHRDLKPPNVMLLSSGEVKLMDFGIAKPARSLRTTYHTGFIGSAYYMAPEQMEGGDVVTPAADIFSLGVMVYQMVTGKVPAGRIMAPSHLCKVPLAWDNLLLQAMDPRPEQRPSSARAFLEELQATQKHSSAGLPPGFVQIEPGHFRMGCPKDEAGSYKNEQPPHHVKLTRGFYLKKTPVTQAEWEAVMGFNPSKFKGADHPVERVSIYDAMTYCNVLSSWEGLEPAYQFRGVRGRPGDEDFWIRDVIWRFDKLGYRLPTEAEWEYACRAGSTTSRYGDLDQIAWHSHNSKKTTQPVGQKEPNLWGLYDMLGNVFEWVFDAWLRNYTKKSVKDPFFSSDDPLSQIETAESLRGINRMARGGSWNSHASTCRAAYRSGCSSGERDFGLGFRTCRTITSR